MHDDAQRLAQTLSRLRAAPADYNFLYCAEDAAGTPRLIVSAGRIDPRLMMSLRTTARDTALMRGTVTWSDGFIFSPATTTHPRFVGHLGLVFRQWFPALRGAEVRHGV